jgi:hypothetical protein
MYCMRLQLDIGISDITRETKATINETFLRILDLVVQLLPQANIPALYQLLGRLFNPALPYNLNRDAHKGYEAECAQLIERVC